MQRTRLHDLQKLCETVYSVTINFWKEIKPVQQDRVETDPSSTRDIVVRAVTYIEYLLSGTTRSLHRYLEDTGIRLLESHQA